MGREGPVSRISPREIRKVYESESNFYGFVEDFFERKIRENGFKLLNLEKGHSFLEIGFGTGCFLSKVARIHGKSIDIYGLELTRGMVERAVKRLERKGLLQYIHLMLGDARNIPFKNGVFDKVYISLTLELFSGENIDRVLGEVERVMKREGKLVIASMCRKDYEDAVFVKGYESLHRKFPKFLNCRPIDLEDYVDQIGLEIEERSEFKLYGVCPIKILRAGKRGI